MKTLIQTVVISTLMIIAGPAWSAHGSTSHAIQILTCEQDSDTSDAKVETMASEWLKAAKKIKGGENLQLSLHFPVAAKSGEIDLLMVLKTPSLGEWGTFMDNYPGSAAEKIDTKYKDDLDCGDSSLWESVEVN